jgi:RimJ/RimL family protein N-acetyltransferase
VSIEELRTARLTLRRYRPGDADDLADAMADPPIVDALPHIPVPYGADGAREWIELAAPALWDAGGAAFAVADSDTDRLVGGVLLTGVTGRPTRPPSARPAGEATVLAWTAPWRRRHGYATEALRAATGWAFDSGLRRLELSTALDNIPAQRAALGAGYRREGIRRGGGGRPDGSRYDAVLWARLDTDPAGRTPRLLPDLPGGELSDGVVTLLPLRPEDVDDVYPVRQRPEVVAATVPPVTPDRGQVARRCRDAASEWLAGAAASLTIREARTDRYAGEIALYYSEPPARSGMIGYHLDPDWRGHGFATRAVRLLTDWAFRHAGLARLEAGTAPRNTASQAVLRRAGFRRVGVLHSRLPGPPGPDGTPTRLDDVLFEVVAGAGPDGRQSRSRMMP